MAQSGFRIEDAYSFAAENGLAREADEIRALEVHASIRRPPGVRKGQLLRLLEERGLFDEFARRHWPAWKSPAAEKRRAHFLRRMKLNERRLRGEDVPDEAGDDPEDAMEELAGFGLEAQLRDFIADNINLITIGEQRLELFRGPDGRAGVEYPTDVGPIDILATDRGGDFYVLELKLERGPDRALGQLARYMGWVKLNLAKTKRVWGVIVASSIDQRLRYAGCVMPDVRLLEYEVEFRLHDVGPMSGSSEGGGAAT